MHAVANLLPRVERHIGDLEVVPDRGARLAAVERHIGDLEDLPADCDFETWVERHIGDLEADHRGRR